MALATGPSGKATKEIVMTSSAKQRPNDRLIKMPEVRRITGLSVSEIYRRVERGQFPKQIRVGPKSVAWVEREIFAWVDLMISGRDDR